MREGAVLISTKASVACLSAVALIGCQSERSVDDMRQSPPDFVKASTSYLERQHDYPDDAYHVSMRNRDGVEFPEGAGAIIVIDSPSVWVTAQCEAIHSTLAWTPNGWTTEASPQCSDALASASQASKKMVLETLSAGAKLTINERGELVITDAAGSIVGIGRPMPPQPFVD
ncbi:hypothetical protein D3C72_912290 [compost metagenome]